MRRIRIITCVLVLLIAGYTFAPAQTPDPNKQIVIAADIVFDGKGGVLHNTRIVI